MVYGLSERLKRLWKPVAKSEQIPAGAKLTFTLCVEKGSPLTESVLRRMFEQGKTVGLGQWRSSGYGTFTFEIKALKH